MNKAIIDTYQELYRKTSKNTVFVFKPEQKQRTAIENFLKLVPSTADEEWIREFLIFQFSRYADQDTRLGKGRIQLNWVIGKKALEKWNSRTSGQLYHTNKFRASHKIQISKKKVEKIPANNFYLNNERRRFYGKERGLIHCAELELFEKENEVCKACKNYKICKNA
jgi:hypothetical protein